MGGDRLGVILSSYFAMLDIPFISSSFVTPEGVNIFSFRKQKLQERFLVISTCLMNA
jgi:hypothetical protein